MNTVYLRFCAFGVMILSVFLSPSYAQVIWTGATDNDWATASNWDTGNIPTTADHVIIPNVTNQPVISGTTSAVFLSGVVQAGATLDIQSNGSLSIDDTNPAVPNVAFENFGVITNDGTINIGLNILVDKSAGLKNDATGIFINNGSFFTDMVGTTGGHVMTNYGTFENNGLFEMRSGAIYFGIFNGGGASSVFENFGQIDSYVLIEDLFVSENSQMDNLGKINLLGGNRGLRISAGSTFVNHECAEYLSNSNINNTGTIDNEGLWVQSVNAVNAGTWNNTGTISLNQLNYLGTPIVNDDIVIFRKNFTNTCGDIIPNTFDIGSTPGSTLSIFTDPAATNSAGTYDIVLNIFTSNTHMPEGINTFYIKITDDAGICPDFTVSWIVDVTYGPTEVTQTGDSGTGSLRCALIQANSYPGSNTITFNLPGATPHTILLASDLPPLDDASTIIDATTQPGWNLGDVVLDGNNNFFGFAIFESDCTIRGIHFDRIDGAAVLADNITNSGSSPTIEDCAFSRISETALELISTDNATIENCLIGTDPSGTSADAGTASIGIFGDSNTNLLIKNCTVSGYDSVDDTGIYLINGDSPIIENCFVGTDAFGTGSIPNDIGIYLGNCSNFLIQNNTISNNTGQGIKVE